MNKKFHWLQMHSYYTMIEHFLMHIDTRMSLIALKSRQWSLWQSIPVNLQSDIIAWLWCVLSQFSRCLLGWRWSGPVLFLFFTENPVVIGRLKFWQGNKKAKILRLPSHSVSREAARIWKWFWKTQFEFSPHTRYTHAHKLWILSGKK